MTALQYAFLLVLSASLLAVAVFAAATVQAVVARRDSGLERSRLGRLTATTRPNEQVWAFLAHRITGVAVLAFLVVHILDVSVYALSPDAFDEIHRLYGTGPMRLFESLLLYAILFHTLNGLRLLLLDVTTIGATGAQWLWRTALGGSLVLGTAGTVVILEPLWA
jgi:succinate dehydrogenase / fumarate reductase, cytochrome b subunit